MGQIQNFNFRVSNIIDKCLKAKLKQKQKQKNKKLPKNNNKSLCTSLDLKKRNPNQGLHGQKTQQITNT